MKTTSAIIGNKPITIFHDDPRFIREVLEHSEYRDVFNDLVVIDLGANIGAFSFWIYDHARIIHAIEPSRRNIECLEKTIELNELTKIKTHCVGISGNGGDRQFYINGNPGGGGWKLDPEPTPVQQSNVAILPTKTLEQFMADEQIEYVDVLKIDIEGGENELFVSKGFRSVAHRITTIVGEFHNAHNSDLAHLLGPSGFRVTFNQDRNHFVARRV